VSARWWSGKPLRTEAELTPVTGGGTGLGLVTAAALAENGAKVYITGRRLETLEAAAKTAAPKSGPGKIIPVQADAATKEGVQSGSMVAGKGPS
jgi:NADP-dependent 3-hydroxy acid dehydrogenase YdfG